MLTVQLLVTTVAHILLIISHGHAQVTCAPLPAIGNGTIEYFPRTSADIPLGTAAIYQCDEGFYLSLEERVRTCEDRDGAGVFIGQTPSCVLAESVFCFWRADQNCGGAFLARTTGSTCCQETEAGGFGGGGYTVLDLNRTCIVCDRDVVVGFDPPSYMVEEGGVVDFRVVLTRNIDVPVTLSFRTENETAVAPDDYTAVQMTLTFNPGDPSEMVVSVETRNDEVTENDEFFTGQLELVSAQSRVSLGISEASVVVFDDDAMCEDLPPLVNGNITYQPDELPRRAGTVANHTCREGYLLIGEKIRECVVMNRTALYDGSAPVCDGAELVLQLEEQSVQFSAVTLDVGLNQSRTIELVEGGSFVISCFSEARGFQQSQVWFRDGFPVEVRAPGNRTADDVSAVYAVLGTGSNQWDLELKVFNHSATGMYSCHRGNEQVSLVVESGNPVVIASNPVLSLDIGSQGGGIPSLIAFVSGNPTPTTEQIKWAHNGVPLNTKGKIFPLATVIERSHMGDYVCSVTTPAGTAITSFTVNINVNCETPEQPVNGSVSIEGQAPHPLGSEVTYHCDDGLFPTGVMTSTCTDVGELRGQWVPDPAQLICSAIPVLCPLEPISNGTVTYTVALVPPSVGTVATYSCDIGFELTGEKMRTCVDITGWTGSLPVCNVTDCGPLTDPINGHVHAPHGTTYNQVATYSCDLGFTLIGPVLRTCGVNREWTQETPQCLEVSITSSGSPKAGQSFSLNCSVMGTHSIPYTIHYVWFKGELQISNSSVLRFDSLFLSDTGEYYCIARIRSAKLEQPIGGSYDIQFDTLNIQLRLGGVSNCKMFIQSDTISKIMDITNKLVLGVEQQCGCGFNHSHISNSFIRCFVASPQQMTYRTVLSGTTSVSTLEVAFLIRQWITMTDHTHETIRVQSVELDVNSTCPLVIVDFDAPDCPESITTGPNPKSSNPTTRPWPTSTETMAVDSLNTSAIVGGVIAGLVGLMFLGLTFVVTIAVLSHRSKHSTGSTERCRSNGSVVLNTFPLNTSTSPPNNGVQETPEEMYVDKPVL